MEVESVERTDMTTAQDYSRVIDAFRTYEREGMAPLERFLGTVRRAYWVESTEFDAYQATLEIDVEAVELPPESAAVKSTKVWLSSGKRGQWQIAGGQQVFDDKNLLVGGTELWNPDDKSGFIKTSKYWQFIERLISLGIEGQYWLALMGRPHNLGGLVGLRAIWVREIIEYKSLDPSDIVLPVQILGATMAPPAPAPTAAPQPIAPPPSMAPAPVGAPPPPPPPPAPPMQPDYLAIITPGWLKYIASVAKAKPVATAAQELFRDANIQTQASIMDSINSPTAPLLSWMEANGWLVNGAGTYSEGATATSYVPPA